MAMMNMKTMITSDLGLSCLTKFIYYILM